MRNQAAATVSRSNDTPYWSSHGEVRIVQHYEPSLSWQALTSHATRERFISSCKQASKGNSNRNRNCNTVCDRPETEEQPRCMIDTACIDSVQPSIAQASPGNLDSKIQSRWIWEEQDTGRNVSKVSPKPQTKLSPITLLNYNFTTEWRNTRC